MSQPFSISVIIPVSERHDDLRELHASYENSLARYSVDFNYIVDGDFPEAVLQLRDLLRDGKDIKIFQLARYYGEATTLTVGFEKSAADVLLTLPAYFQVEPADLPRLLDALDDNDMVVCRRFPRFDSGFNRLQTRLFHWGLGHFTGKPFHDLGCSVRAIRREVINNMQIYGDQHRFLPVLAIRRGYRVGEIDLPQSKRDPYRRVYAPGLYARRSLDLLTILFLTKFTQKPLRFFGLIGSGMGLAGGAAITVMVIQRLFFETALDNRPALLLAALLVVLGVQLFALGLVGELIIYIHARELKEYTVKEIVN
jgi:hypothetical protein